MTDYGHPLMFGSFLTPTGSDPGRPVALAQLSEAAGLDLVTFQDHPYQAAFLDAAWAAMRPHVDGLYIGYTTETGPQVTREAYRSNLERLREIKNRYDPRDLFRSL